MGAGDNSISDFSGGQNGDAAKRRFPSSSYNSLIPHEESSTKAWRDTLEPPWANDAVSEATSGQGRCRQRPISPGGGNKARARHFFLPALKSETLEAVVLEDVDLLGTQIGFVVFERKERESPIFITAVYVGNAILQKASVIRIPDRWRKDVHRLVKRACNNVGQLKPSIEVVRLNRNQAAVEYTPIYRPC